MDRKFMPYMLAIRVDGRNATAAITSLRKSHVSPEARLISTIHVHKSISQINVYALHVAAAPSLREIAAILIATEAVLHCSSAQMRPAG
jgi:hypothetical protein